MSKSLIMLKAESTPFMYGELEAVVVANVISCCCFAYHKYAHAHTRTCIPWAGPRLSPSPSLEDYLTHAHMHPLGQDSPPPPHYTHGTTCPLGLGRIIPPKKYCLWIKP